MGGHDTRTFVDVAIAMVRAREGRTRCHFIVTWCVLMTFQGQYHEFKLHEAFHGQIHVGSQIHVKIESMFPSLVIWNENTHIMKNVEYELHSWLPCSCYSELHAYDREAKNFVGTYCGSNDRRYSGRRLVRLSCLYFRNAASSPVCLDFLKY